MRENANRTLPSLNRAEITKFSTKASESQSWSRIPLACWASCSLLAIPVVFAAHAMRCGWKHWLQTWLLSSGSSEPKVFLCFFLFLLFLFKCLFGSTPFPSHLRATVHLTSIYGAPAMILWVKHWLHPCLSFRPLSHAARHWIQTIILITCPSVDSCINYLLQ